MSLLFNMLSMLVITFLPRSKRLLISWLQSSSAVILEPKTIKSATVSTVSPYSKPPEIEGLTPETCWVSKEHPLCCSDNRSASLLHSFPGFHLPEPPYCKHLMRSTAPKPIIPFLGFIKLDFVKFFQESSLILQLVSLCHDN